MSTTVGIRVLTPRAMMLTTVGILCLTPRSLMSTTLCVMCFNPQSTDVNKYITLAVMFCFTVSKIPPPVFPLLRSRLNILKLSGKIYAFATLSFSHVSVIHSISQSVRLTREIC